MNSTTLLEMVQCTLEIITMWCKRAAYKKKIIMQISFSLRIKHRAKSISIHCDLACEMITRTRTEQIEYVKQKPSNKKRIKKTTKTTKTTPRCFSILASFGFLTKSSTYFNLTSKMEINATIRRGRTGREEFEKKNEFMRVCLCIEIKSLKCTHSCYFAHQK